MGCNVNRTVYIFDLWVIEQFYFYNKSIFLNEGKTLTENQSFLFTAKIENFIFGLHGNKAFLIFGLLVNIICVLCITENTIILFGLTVNTIIFWPNWKHNSLMRPNIKHNLFGLSTNTTVDPNVNTIHLFGLIINTIYLFGLIINTIHLFGLIINTIHLFGLIINTIHLFSLIIIFDQVVNAMHWI